MKTKPTLLALLIASLGFLSTLCAAEAEKPLSFPELQLADGRILKKAVCAEFKADGVLVRYAGGSLFMRYEAFPQDFRAEVEQHRPGGPRYYQGETAVKKTEVSGQVFITTRGAGAYKFPGVKVYAFAAEHLALFDFNSNPVCLPKPLTMTTTDADGKFTLELPSGSAFFLFAQAGRLAGDHSESFEWRVPGDSIKDKKHAMINEDFRYQPRPVVIEPMD